MVASFSVCGDANNSQRQVVTGGVSLNKMTGQLLTS